MKKYLLMLLCCFVFSGNLAWSAGMGGEGKGTKKEHKMREYVEMKSGKMVIMKNGTETPMEQDMTMSNGTVVRKDGSYTMKDGKTGTLTEGEMMHMNGKIMKQKKGGSKKY